MFFVKMKFQLFIVNMERADKQKVAMMMYINRFGLTKTGAASKKIFSFMEISMKITGEHTKGTVL